VGEVIPVFPLSAVLLPGMPLPLHIFEQRYRELMHDIAAAPGGGRFGVAVLRSGSEVLNAGDASGPPDVAPVGTVAEILEVTSNDDGTSDVLSVGGRRFRIETLIADGKPYLRADVHYLDETDGAIDAAQVSITRELIIAYDRLLTRLAGRPTGAELPDDATQLGYHVGARLPLVPEDRQALLEIDTTAARLAQVNRLLRREIALLRRTRSIAVAPAIIRLAPGLN
jgi:Lon protease-like protein